MNDKYNKLTPEEERVILHKGTEMPFSGKYDSHSEEGFYICKRCGEKLFKSNDKFDAGCGWPSFDDEISGAIKKIPDADGLRTEIQCNNCGSHLGHVFFGERMTEKNKRYCVNSISLNFDKKNYENQEAIVLGGGCFWCVEAAFQDMEGIQMVTSGYAGGTLPNLKYDNVVFGKSGHAEVVEIVFNPKKIKLEKILDIFFVIHDPTTLNRQGNDVGTQYRSIILFAKDEQENKVKQFIKDKQKEFNNNIITEVKKLDKFYVAEEYHQNYYKKNPDQAYCQLVIKPKLDKLNKNT